MYRTKGIPQGDWQTLASLNNGTFKWREYYVHGNKNDPGLPGLYAFRSKNERENIDQVGGTQMLGHRIIICNGIKINKAGSNNWESDVRGDVVIDGVSARDNQYTHLTQPSSAISNNSYLSFLKEIGFDFSQVNASLPYFSSLLDSYASQATPHKYEPISITINSKVIIEKDDVFIDVDEDIWNAKIVSELFPKTSPSIDGELMKSTNELSSIIMVCFPGENDTVNLVCIFPTLFDDDGEIMVTPGGANYVRQKQILQRKRSIGLQRTF